MRKNSCISALLVVSLVLSALVVAYRFEFAVKAENQGLLDGIDSALDWCDRDYCEIGTMISNVTGANVSIAIARSGAFLDFRLKHSDNNWTVSGKMTDVNLPPSATMIRGGGRPDQCVSQYKLWFSPVANRLCVNWTFDTDGDTEYGDVQVYTEMGAINDTFTGLYGEITKFTNNGFWSDLYLEFDEVVANVSVGKNFTRTQEYGWWGRNYYMRPAVKGLADLYMQCQALGYGTSRGINYTDRARKLYGTYYGSGYTIDRFDGMYNVTLLTRAFPDLHGGLPPDPDLVLEKPWDFLDSETHAVAGYYDWNDSIGDYDQTWYNYSDVLSGGGYADPSAGNLAYSYIWRHPMESRVCMPDEKYWNNAPFQCSDSEYAYCYRSRTGFTVARNCYIGNGFPDDIPRQYTNCPAIPPSIIEGLSADSRFTRLCEDLFKYGSNIWYGKAKAKEMLDHVVWDGNGIPIDELVVGSGIGWTYCAYNAHTIVPYMLACCLYYQIWGDEFYAKRADEVAGVLLKTQITEGVKVYSKDLLQDYYMPQEIGGFMSGYMVAYSYGQCGIHWQDFTTPIYNSMSWWYDVWHGALGFKFDQFNHMNTCSAESSIPATWALMYYRQLGRTPKSPSVPAYYLPMDSSSMYVLTDHWGAWGGDGASDVADQYESKTHIGGSSGNLDNWTGAISKFRMYAYGGSVGSAYGYSTVEFVFPSVNVTFPLTDFGLVAHFSMPEWSAGYIDGENYLKLNATVYYANDTLVATDTRTPLYDLSGMSGGTGGKLVSYDDLCSLAVLPVGTYRMSLKFTACATGTFATMRSGYALESKGHHGIPMGFELVGYNYSYPMFNNVTWACRNKNDDYGSFWSLLNNSGFETGSLNQWYDWDEWGEGTQPEAVASNAWQGTYSCRFEDSHSDGECSSKIQQDYFFSADVPYYSTITLDYKLRPSGKCFWNATVGYTMWETYVSADHWSLTAWYMAYNDSSIDEIGYEWYDVLTGITTNGSAVVGDILSDNIYHNLTLSLTGDHHLLWSIDGTERLHVHDVDHYASDMACVLFWSEVNYAKRFYNLDNVVLNLTGYFPAEYKLLPVVSNTYWGFWTLRNSTGFFMYSPVQFLNLTTNYAFNITAFYYEFNYTNVYNYTSLRNLTGIADIVAFDGKVDAKDVALTALLYGTDSGDPDWKSSHAEAVDDLLVPDNKIDAKDIALVASNFGTHYYY